MKKIYTLVLSSIISIGISSAQVNLPEINPISTIHTLSHQAKATNNKSVTCVDTIRYPQSKLSTTIELDTLTTGLREGIAQYYHYNGTGSIKGITAYILTDLDGIPNYNDSVVLIARVMNVNAYNEPITQIDSSLVTIHDVGFNEQVLMFDSPINVTDSFAIALEITTPFNDTLLYATNNSVNFDGGTEGLASIAYAGIWYNYYKRGWGWDIDMILSPIFEKNITASYSVDTNSVCLGSPITFTNTSDAIYNSMFNTTTNTDSLNLDDGNAYELDTSYSYTYITSGSFNTNFTLTQYGYSSNCSDVSNLSVTVLDTAISNFTYVDLGGGTFQFTDISSPTGVINSWQWDYDDGSPLNGNQSPLHTFSSASTYNVCLTVQDSNGCNANTSCQSISFTTGLQDVNEIKEILVYPIPAKKDINLSIPSKYYNSEIIIRDVVGQEVKTLLIEENEKIKLSTNDIPSGIYFISINKEGSTLFTRRIVVDK